ncbi:MAG: MBL fold metallo-hydrolase [Gammaproteobacteria bacterium]|nr:MBL fold metallo-hydrolase [Gammaproteobacteria bacterium]
MPDTPGFSISQVGDGVSLLEEQHVASWLRCNIWYIQGRDRDLLIDSGMGLIPLKPAVATLSDNAITAVSTHAHFDHIGGAHEFDCHLGHAADKHIYANPTAQNTLAKDFVTAESITISPYEGFSVDTYTVTPAPLTGYIDEGDIIDLGDRYYRVLHLPGHAPGAISLYEEKTKTLFSGDVIYQGGLIDNAYHSNLEQYEASLLRLKELPIETIHGGHEPSFGRSRMIEIIDEFLAGGQRYHYEQKRD